MSESVTRGVVSQDSYQRAEEDGIRAVRLNPRGELVVPDWMTQLVLDGRVYNVSTEVQETATLFSETARGTDNINPSMLLDVPTGTTVIPLEILISVSGTGTAADIDVQVSTDDAVRYSSGGNAVTPINMRKDDPNTSACSFYEGGTQVVAIANVDDDTIYYRRLDTTMITAPTVQLLDWTAKKYTPPVLIGPAALLVFVISGNVDHSFFYSLKYAEFSTTHIT